ncbi:hypothetical protein GGI07_002224 [Coemansia sp. Benny D115]|nr:hypothetical protein GGI07_002224 [Coemansia sp. Benny D115]
MSDDAFIDASVAFLYASQTGNAESICYNIYQEALGRGFRATYHVLDDHARFDFAALRTVVFVVSTTGDGDPPDNSTKFWRVLRRTAKNNAFAHLRYAILGLGDTNYSNFCNTAVRLDRQLEDAGAHSFYPKGMADDATGLEEVVEPWIDGLWAALEKVARSEKTAASQAPEPEAASGAQDAKESAPAALPGALDGAMAGLRLASPESPPPHQPLVLDFRPMADLKAITGAPKLPAHALALRLHDEPADSADRPSSSSSSPSLSAATYPPWHAELADGHAGDATLRPFLATVAASRQLTSADALKRTLLVDLELPASHNASEDFAGDSFNVFAPTPAASVDRLLELLGIRDAWATLEPLNEKAELPAHLQRFALSATPTARYRLRDILRWSVDLHASPRKQTLRALAECCTDTEDRDRLLYLSSRQGTKAFEDLRMQNPGILDILGTFTSCRPSMDRLLELLPPLAPRSYSICNAPGQGRWQFAFNVVEYRLDVVDPFSAAEEEPRTVAMHRKGLCTPWLAHLADSLGQGELPQVLVGRRPGHFRLPPSAEVPVIMVGPGTGVAPFIGFLQQRELESKQAGKQPSSLPLSWLFFGCRSPHRDELFGAELRQWVERGTLGKLSLCYSRDAQAREAQGASVYVQDAMLKHADELADLLVKQMALLYVCGDAKGMGKDVNNMLAQILCSYANKHPECLAELGFEGKPLLSQVDALQLLMRWSKEHRYLRDLWA